MKPAIWKYELRPQQNTSLLAIKKGALLRHVGSINEKICLWMEVDEDAGEETRKFMVVGTSWDLPPDRKYLGTVVMPPFVWHVLEFHLPTPPTGTDTPPQNQGEVK